MANRTEKTAKTVKGTNPQFLVEKIIRQRIYDSMYWKEHCFALTAELVVDKGMDLRYIGGIYAGNIKPTPFLCLALKMLQIQPDKDIVLEFIQQEEFKYIRALGAMYLRLTFDSTEIYKYLEPLYNDFRKLRYMNKMGRFEAIYMDEFIDNLLREDRYCDIQLPRLQKRWALEEVETLAPYKSLLDGDLVAIRRSRSRDRERDVGDRREVREREKMRERRERGDNEPGPSSSSSARRDDRDDRRRDRDRSRDRKDRKDDERRDRKKDSSRRGADNDEEREIAEANALRAKLGMAPLER
uniref:Pre-mRNA-splicing factor 38 n=1 Tax=Caenorhabditis tropicalis TaxID=1561998 RepID=A0A1I7U783_9PELO